MECLAPITLYRKEGTNNSDDFQSDIVPCGKCPSCLARRSAGWVFRIEEEQRHSNTAAFLTLTYNKENLPWSENGLPTLRPKDHQDFIKRLRKNVNKHFKNKDSKSIRYYAIGEYGTLAHRPHYHAIIFNLPQQYINHPELLEKDWGKGHTQTASCTGASIGYVTGYINNTLYTDPTHPDDDRKKEFSHMSKGLGKQYLTPARMAYYKKNLTPYLITEGGQKAAMPRYYRNKLYSFEEKLAIKLKVRQHIKENPTFPSEKAKRDYIVNKFNKHKHNVKLKRQKL